MSEENDVFGASIVKWICILWAVVAIAGFAANAVESYSLNKTKQEAIKAGLVKEYP